MRGSGAFCDIGRCLFCPAKGSGGIVLTVKPGCKASGGVIRSENVDMSSDKAGEKPARRKPKVSYATFIGVG